MRAARVKAGRRQVRRRRRRRRRQRGGGGGGGKGGGSRHMLEVGAGGALLKASRRWPNSSPSSHPNASYRSSTSRFSVVARLRMILPPRGRRQAHRRGAQAQGAREGRVSSARGLTHACACGRVRSARAWACMRQSSPFASRGVEQGTCGQPWTC